MRPLHRHEMASPLCAAKSPTLLFVHLGPALPPWLSLTLRQARIFNSCRLVLVSERVAEAARVLPRSLELTHVHLEELGISPKQRLFRQLSPLDRGFRQGFWMYASERFFVVETAIRALVLEHVLHVENDVMLYSCLDELAPRLSRLYAGLAATFDNDTRCVPGIVYIPHEAAIAALTDFYLGLLQGALPQARPVNDMTVLGLFRTRGPPAIDHLPVLPPDYPAGLHSTVGHLAAEPARYWQHFDALGCIFDAAALGQFLGGVDPRNAAGSTVGFINESCVFDPRLLAPRLVRDAAGRRIPVVQTRSGLHRVANLHVHSKNPGPFLSLDDSRSA